VVSWFERKMTEVPHGRPYPKSHRPKWSERIYWVQGKLYYDEALIPRGVFSIFLGGVLKYFEFICQKILSPTHLPTSKLPSKKFSSSIFSFFCLPSLYLDERYFHHYNISFLYILFFANFRIYREEITFIFFTREKGCFPFWVSYFGSDFYKSKSDHLFLLYPFDEVSIIFWEGDKIPGSFACRVAPNFLREWEGSLHYFHRVVSNAYPRGSCFLSSDFIYG
jgi:hypothetical protein